MRSSILKKSNSDPLFRYYADKEDAYNMRKYFDMEFRELNLQNKVVKIKKHEVKMNFEDNHDV